MDLGKAGKFTMIAATILVLAACATAQPFQVSGGPQNNALVEGDSGAMSWLPGGHNLVFIESINGKKIGASESQVLLPPGKYTFGLQCEIDFIVFGTQTFMGNQNLAFNVEAGHTYKFMAELAKQTVQGNSIFAKTYNDEKANSCIAFVYDATGSKGPYPETVHVVPPHDPSGWKGSGKAYAGHSIQDWLLNGEDENHWNQMIEIEFWSNLMYPESADQLYHARIADAEKQCPGTQSTRISESTNDFIFELQNSGCAASAARFQLSRFMTGKYGVYEVSYLSSNPVTEGEIAAWLKVLQNANIVLQH